MAKEIMTTKLGKDGRIVLPVKVRRALQLRSGQNLGVTVQKGLVTLRPTLDGWLALQKRSVNIRPKPGEMLVSEQLIAERRAEAKREFGA